jgi:hypothetical protein
MRVASQLPKLNGKAQRVADLSFRGALAAVASNALTIAGKPPKEQRAALVAWEKHNCKNAHQALCRAERSRTENRSAAAHDDAVMKVLNDVPAEKRRAVVEWAEEKEPGAPLTAATIRTAAKEVIEAEPDDGVSEPPEQTSWRFQSAIRRYIAQWRAKNPAVAASLLSIALTAVAVELEKESEISPAEADA